MGDTTDTLYLGAGCFWHSELVFAQQPGVSETEVGWCKYTPEDLDKQGRVEVVKVEFDPKTTTIPELVAEFWKTHKPKSKRNEDRYYVERSMLFARDDTQYQLLQQLLQQRKEEEPETKTEVAKFDSYHKAPAKDQKYYFKQ